MCSLSAAHKIARVSLSVWEYCSSTEISNLLTYAMMRRSSRPGLRFERQPKGDASLVSSDGLVLSK